MASSPTEYEILFDIGETVELLLSGVPAVVTAIIIEGDYTVAYRCAYMRGDTRGENVFTLGEIRSRTANGKGGKRVTPRAVAKKTG